MVRILTRLAALRGKRTDNFEMRPADVAAVLWRDGAFPGVHIRLNEEAVQRSAAARGVRVLLSGFGGDEGASFGGRGSYVHLL